MKKLRRIMLNGKVQLVAVVVVAGLISFGAVVATANKKAVAGAKSCQAICVSLTKDGISPDTLAVKVGEYVQFNSADGQQHNIGLGGGEADKQTDATGHEHHEHVGDYTSGDFVANEAWRVQFKQPGTYKFHDHYNPNLNILIVVYDPAGSKKL